MPVVTHFHVLNCRIHLREEDLLVVKYATRYRNLTPPVNLMLQQSAVPDREIGIAKQLVGFVASSCSSVEYAVMSSW